MEKTLFVSRNFPPLAGGMERLNYHAYQALGIKRSVALCGPVGAAAFVDGAAHCVEIPISPLYRFLLECQWKSLRMASRFRPDMVYSGSGLTAPAALGAGRFAGARTVCFLHGLDLVANNIIYQRLFLPAIRQFDRILANSQHTAGLAMAAGVPRNNIMVIHPGVELPELSERDPARNRFRKRHGLGHRPMLLSAGRLTQRKGLVEFIRYAFPEIMHRCPEVALVIVGEEPCNALKHRAGVKNEIHKAIVEVGAESHVTLLGAIDDNSLSEAYFAADLLAFPVLDLPDDVEGFGMVALEAAAHGLPTVAFSVGGVPDAVAEGISGFLIPPGQYQAMAQRIAEQLCAGSFSGLQRCTTFAERFAWSEFTKKLLEACQF